MVVVHLEGTQQPRRFIEAARSVGSKKPVIVWKTGTTEQAARVSQSHTGSITGSAAVWETALRSCGALQVTELDELTDLVKAFSCLPPMRGRNIGISTFTGGFAIIAMDACARHNMNLPRFSGQALFPLASQSPSWLHLRNPADIWPAVGSQSNYREMFATMRQSFRSILAEPGVDALLFIGGAFSRDFTAGLAQSLVGAAEEFPDKPVIGYFYGPFAIEGEGMVAASGKAAVFPSSERAIRALSRMAAYHERR
jgi:acetyltransferase